MAAVSLPHRTLDTQAGIHSRLCLAVGRGTGAVSKALTAESGRRAGPPAAAGSSPGSASLAWPLRRGFHTWPTTGQQVIGKSGLFLSRWQPPSRGTGLEKPRCACGAGSAVRSCWRAWTLAEAREGIGAPARSLCCSDTLPRDCSVCQTLTFSPNACASPQRVRRLRPGPSGVALRREEAVGRGTSLWELK